MKKKEFKAIHFTFEYIFLWLLTAFERFFSYQNDYINSFHHVLLNLNRVFQVKKSSLYDPLLSLAQPRLLCYYACYVSNSFFSRGRLHLAIICIILFITLWKLQLIGLGAMPKSYWFYLWESVNLLFFYSDKKKKKMQGVTL